MIAKCENCGAALDAAPTAAPGGGFDRVCTYCGARNHTAPRPAPHAAVPRVVFVPPVRAPRSDSRWVIPWIVFGVVAAGAISVFAMMKSAAVGGAAPPAALERKNGPAWESYGGPPVLATVAGSEAIVGRLRNIGGDDLLFIGAFDAATAAERWQVGPFGTYIEGYQATHFAVSGDHVIVSDFHASAHVYARETGKEERTLTLTDRVKSICPVAPDKAWVEQIDKRTVLVDLATGSATAAPRPAACPDEHDFNPFGDQELTRKMPKIEGFQPLRLLRDDPVAVVFGKKAPGTPTPIAVGVDPGTLAAKWQVTLPAVDIATVRDESLSGPKFVALHGDRFVDAYGVGQKGWHVTALDAKTGTRQWDVVLQPIFAVDSINGVLLSESHLFIVRMQSVEVRDAASGKLLGVIGHETYESGLPR